jgi:FkbM family methyltransferase
LRITNSTFIACILLERQGLPARGGAGAAPYNRTVNDPRKALKEAAAGATAARAKDKGEAFERLQAQAERLPLKHRVRLLDALMSLDVAEREDGVKFSVRSVTEFKRFSKSKPADEPMVDWIQGFGPADVFYDIGANTGALSLLAGASHGGRVPVFAFEPAFDNFESLVRNVLANGLEAVITPFQVALFDETALRPFHYYRRGAGSALHAVGQPLDFLRRPFEPAAVHPVMAFRLDDLVQTFRLPRPTRIKLDVDGFEDRVLAGAEGVLTSGRIEIVVELVQRDPADMHPAGVMSFLAGLGYRQVSVVERRPPGTYPRAVDALFRRD